METTEQKIVRTILNFIGIKVTETTEQKIVRIIQNLRSKAAFIIINFITWIIAWAIPLTYTKGRYYRESAISRDKHGDYMAFGIFLIPFCLISIYCSYRILANVQVKQYIKEYGNKIKAPIFLLLLGVCLIYIVPHTGKMAYGVYTESMPAGIIQLIIMFLETTLLSTLYVSIYKTFRNK
ncbi:hypothetical protein [Candidatus Liberibacter brunswickensis]|uniref:hypothetical protein n=1 Tax=Candidatus Liberibacter brunswickensis TaxID=1968796 RepID=UPI002FE01F92